jgi:hypothetical protein
MRQREPGMASGAQTLKNGVARGVGARINQARGGGIKRLHNRRNNEEI